MVRFAVIGTNFITERFIDATHQSGNMTLGAVYSRTMEQAKAFGSKYQVTYCFDSLEALAKTKDIDAVYIASPNSVHCEQTLFFLNHGKHVICEKPLASTLAEAEAMIACAKKNKVILFEAFKTAYLPNFIHTRECLPMLGKIRKAYLSYCQYSSRYQRYLDGENPNTFNPEFSNGSIMDIGYYCIASAIALWGEPKTILASASLLASGVDGHGSVILNYGDFDAVITHSKVSNSLLPSEIQGEDGVLTIEGMPLFSKVIYTPRGGEAQNMTLQQVQNGMVYEADAFVRLIEKGVVEHSGLALSRSVAKVLTEIRRQTGVHFPADKD